MLVRMHSQLESRHRPAHGFTLVELLVVIVIIGVLAGIAMVETPKFINKGRKVQALTQFKELALGFGAFDSDNNRPLIPRDERIAGQDTVYSTPKSKYSNGIIVAVLGGTSESLRYKIVDFNIKDINPKEEVYMTFKVSDKKTNGVGSDGVYYDPWGKPMMFAVNAFKSTSQNAVLVDFNATTPGKNDSRLYTYGLAEYSDTKPNEESYVVWSYGKDGIKGSTKEKGRKLPPFDGADDVASWR